METEQTATETPVFGDASRQGQVFDLSECV
jgi:hypothetical protein